MTMETYIAQRACPICGGHDAIALHEQRFVLPADSLLPAVYTVASCARCGACFADTSAPQSTYDRYYERFSKYDDPALGTGGGVSAADRARLKETAELLASLPLPRCNASRVLDIGCAGGGLLAALAAEGFRHLSGVDPSRACVERVRRLGFDCRQGGLCDLPAAVDGEFFDVVVLSHVVEHLVDVSAAMSSVRTILSAGGMCFVEVPDASRYDAAAFVPYYFFDSEHINHFSPATLRNLAAGCAFDIVCDGQRDLRLDGDLMYPAAWILLRKITATRPLEHDYRTRLLLAGYIERSGTPAGTDPLDALADGGCPVLLWGAGSHAQRLLQQSPLARCNLVGIVDRDPVKQGRALLGHLVGEPDAALAQLGPDVAVVIASVLHGDQIAAEIASKGMSNRVVLAK